MKKLGIIIFGVALVLGVVLANFTSFGSAAFKSPVSFVFGSRVHGSGNVITESRNTGDFNGIAVSGILNVEVTKAEKVSVVVEADDNIAPLIKTVVKAGTLKIWSEKRFKSGGRITIKVAAPNIENLDTSGVSKITFKGVSNDSLNIETSGASKVTVEGTATSLNIDMSGASKVSARNLVAEKANIDGSGASSAVVSVTTFILADVSGASSVKYKGDPANLKKSVSGAGSINKID